MTGLNLVLQQPLTALVAQKRQILQKRAPIATRLISQRNNATHAHWLPTACQFKRNT